MRGLPWSFRIALCVWMALTLTACQVPQERKTVAPSEKVLRERAQEQLTKGLSLYESGDYDGTLKSLQAALDHGLLSKGDQSNARKHMAFILCVSGREAECREQFRRALEIDPQFDLTSAEAGHPVWGPVYSSERAQMGLENLAAESKASVPLSKAKQLLAAGLRQYDLGDYPGAQATLQEALKEGLYDKADRVRALKYSAFSLCLMGKQSRCRAEFRKIFEIEPGFELAAVEVGHPSWQRAYTQARTQARAAARDRTKE
jgi:Tfp pilus assembly protein PilF